MAANPVEAIPEVIVTYLRKINWLWMLIGLAVGWFLLPRSRVGI